MNSVWKNICLDGDWSMWLAPNKALHNKGKDICTPEALNTPAFTAIPAVVPGNFELDMQRAGLIDDPFAGDNILRLQELENRHVWYAKKFTFTGNTDSAYFRFEGIDTFADIYLNGRLIASTSNMLIPYEIKAEGIKAGENELFIHISPAVIVARETPLDSECFASRYNYDSLRVRKAPHGYGWDIMPRAVSAGLWRSVRLFEKPDDRIEEVFIHTVKIDRKADTAVLCAFYHTAVCEDSLKGYKIKMRGVCGDSVFEAVEPLWYVDGKITLTVQNAKLWWTKDLGEANLYDVTFELIKDDKTVDTMKTRTGIRTVALDRTSTTDSMGSGEFCFKINGEKLFVRGTNWVPLDAFHSRDKERLPAALDLLDDIGCNMVRCWGGNVYESDAFFDFCDENGILIWQDFAMACALYPQDDAFCKVIANEVELTVRRLRNHPCVGLWAGDNENDVAYQDWAGISRDPNFNKLTRQVIPDVLRRTDSSRPYLPSSPYIDSTAFGKDFTALPENHLWGPRDNFKSKFYAGSTAHFASELGYHGCPSPESVKKFITPEKLWPWKDNPEWILHASSPETDPNSCYAYRIELMAKQIRELFSKMPETLEEFALASQISQAEACKFYMELFRTAKWRRTGLIWWNLIDGWPQFSDAVVDYYGTKKLAYHFLKTSGQPVCLMFSEPDNWQIGLVAANDTPEPVSLTYTVRDLTDDTLVLSGEATVAPNASERINSLRYCMSEHRFYLIEWQCGAVSGKNHYITGYPPYDLEQYIACLKKAGLYQLEGFTEV